MTTSDLPVESVVGAADGVEAISQLRCSDVNLDLSDINMPNTNGEDFVRKIREDDQYAKVKVVMIATDSSLGARP